MFATGISSNLNQGSFRKVVVKNLLSVLILPFLVVAISTPSAVAADETISVVAPGSVALESVSQTINITGASLQQTGMSSTQEFFMGITLKTPATGASLTLVTTTGLTPSYGYTSSNFTNFTTVTFTGTQANINAALATLQVATGNGSATSQIEITATVNVAGLAYNSPTGHFYKGVAANAITYTAADAAAKASTYQGQRGYLATVTSSQEQDFVNSKVNAQNIWIGGTDAGLEGVWKWDPNGGSPEAGLVFWRAACTTSKTATNCATATTYSASGAKDTSDGLDYEDWCPSGGSNTEPNNADAGRSGEHHLLTKWNQATCWNDYNGANTGGIGGYIIEYGTNSTGGGFTGFSTAIIMSNTQFASAPSTPETPTVTAGDGRVRITVRPTFTGGGIETTTVTAAPGGATCEVVGGNGFCDITGLTNGTAYTFTTVSRNSSNTSATSPVSATVTPYPALAIATPTTGLTSIRNTAFTLTVAATGGVGSKTYAAIGTLPPGLTLNTSTGVISGTPTTVGSYAIQIRATDADAVVVTTSSFTIVINNPASLVSAYRIDWATNTGTGYMNPQYAFIGSTVVLESNILKKDGHSFAGWNTKADGTGTAYTDGGTFKIDSSDVILYAQWKLVQTKPTITWATPTAIQEGTALGATQLNALASVPGTYTYAPASAALLPVGKNTIKVSFVPTDPKFESVQATVEIEVLAKAKVTWANPAAIVEGAALGATQLNATASVPGTFTYAPAAGTVLPVGKNTIKVTFTPTDTRLSAVTAEVSVDVTAKPAVVVPPVTPVKPVEPAPTVITSKQKVYFAMSSFKLDAKAKADLTNLANKALAAGTNFKVTVVGFTQPTAKDPNFKALANNRAKAAANFLRSLGVKGSYSINGVGQAPRNVPSSRYAEVTVIVQSK
jgi:outer membrane protein OmpA-like peptidoglycan-associated protein